MSGEWRKVMLTLLGSRMSSTLIACVYPYRDSLLSTWMDLGGRQTRTSEGPAPSLTRLKVMTARPQRQMLQMNSVDSCLT